MQPASGLESLDSLEDKQLMYCVIGVVEAVPGGRHEEKFRLTNILFTRS